MITTLHLLQLSYLLSAALPFSILYIYPRLPMFSHASYISLWQIFLFANLFPFCATCMYRLYTSSLLSIFCPLCSSPFLRLSYSAFHYLCHPTLPTNPNLWPSLLLLAISHPILWIVLLLPCLLKRPLPSLWPLVRLSPEPALLFGTFYKDSILPACLQSHINVLCCQLIFTRKS